LITTFLINLVVQELPGEHRAAGVLRRHVVVPRWGGGGEGAGTNLLEGGVLLVAFTSAGRAFAASVVSCARRWIWRS
jgi:hypothetical protein